MPKIFTHGLGSVLYLLRILVQDRQMRKYFRKNSMNILSVSWNPGWGCESNNFLQSVKWNVYIRLYLKSKPFATFSKHKTFKLTALTKKQSSRQLQAVKANSKTGMECEVMLYVTPAPPSRRQLLHHGELRKVASQLPMQARVSCLYKA